MAIGDCGPLPPVALCIQIVNQSGVDLRKLSQHYNPDPSDPNYTACCQYQVDGGASNKGIPPVGLVLPNGSTCNMFFWRGENGEYFPGLSGTVQFTADGHAGDTRITWYCNSNSSMGGTYAPDPQNIVRWVPYNVPDQPLIRFTAASL